MRKKWPYERTALLLRLNRKVCTSEGKLLENNWKENIWYENTRIPKTFRVS